MDNKDLGEKILKIDKSNWKLTKLGTLAVDISVRVDKPGNSEYDRFVGLDNFVSGDIKIKSWASTKNLTSSAKAFKSGDILFARRNAYLRRASLVDFNGCCSGDAFVIRENLEKVVPGYLAFLLNTNALWDYANSNAAGTMSKRVKWRDLAEYEFLLPPKAEQARLAELLWAIDEVIEKEKVVLGKIEVLFKSSRNHFVENGTYDSTKNSKKTRFGKVCTNWQMQKLSSFAELTNGYAFKSEEFLESGKFQVLRIGNITDNGFDFSKSAVFKNVISEAEKKFLIPRGAIVLSLTGTNGKRDYGFPSLMDDNEKFLLNQRLVMIVPNREVMLPEFLFLISKMEIFQGRFFLNATGTANQANVSSSDVALIELPVPSINEQVKFLKIIESLRLGITNSKKKITNSQSLQKSLINQIF